MEQIELPHTLKVICCECKKVLKPGPDDIISHGLCEPCSIKMLWSSGLSQDEITDFSNRDKGDKS